MLALFDSYSALISLTPDQASEPKPRSLLKNDLRHDNGSEKGDPRGILMPRKCVIGCFCAKLSQCESTVRLAISLFQQAPNAQMDPGWLANCHSKLTTLLDAT